MMIDFSDIPAFKPPSPEERRNSAIEWLKPQYGTCLDQLPKDVLELGPKTHFINLPVDREFIEDLFEAEAGTRKSVIELARQLDDVFGWNEHVAKISTRSPKDSWSNNGVTISGKQAVAWFAASMRVLDDLVKLSNIPDIYTPQVCAREAFIPADGIRGNMEFRCFVSDQELIGISDYDYANPISRDDSFWGACLSQITDWYNTQLKPRMHMDTYVFDVVMSTEGWQLIEVNPYGLSDPCFYKSYAELERIGLSQGIVSVDNSQPEIQDDDHDISPE